MSNLHSFQEALRQSPENVPLLLLYGQACLEELELEQAVEAYERAVKLEPRRTDAQLGLARALFSQGNVSQAAVRAEVALKEDEHSAAAHLLLSRIFLTEGDPDRAKTHFQKACDLDHSLIDIGLEQELGLSAEGSRRSAAASQAEANDTPGTSEDGPAGEDAVEAEPEAFMDEAPYDWRPETFLMPGDPERSRVAFEDIVGLDAIEEEIRRKIVYPLQQPELHRTYGHQAGGALLLYGPPGCGKTMLLRAVAAEVPCNYLSVGLHEVFDPYFGSPERNLHQLFDTARLNAPCVLAIDGLDSLAPDRRQIRDGQLRNVVNQLLHELDVLRTEGRRVLVLGATSQPWVLDPALRRPGRFEQALLVPPPDAKARRALIERGVREKPVGSVDIDQLVQLTDGFSAADVQWVFDRAAELALGEAMQAEHPEPIQDAQLLQVARQHRASTWHWFEGAAQDSELFHDGSVIGEVRKYMAGRGLKAQG